MKTTTAFSGFRQHRQGFTLVELLVVITIIVVLAGIIFVAGGRLGVVSDTKQTEVTLQNIGLKLEEYASDNNGIYPVGEDSSSAAIYRALSGDLSGRGEAPTEEVYWSELTDAKNPALIGVESEVRVIRDGFGHTIRYRAARDADGEVVENVRNDADFDLWSVGPDGEPRDLNTPGTLENEDTKDDIWR